MKPRTERLLAGLQTILPQHFLSRIVYALMRSKTRWLKNFLILRISHLAGINFDEAISTELDDYPCFNAWFTRALKPGARNFDPDTLALLSPSDGRISETGFLLDEQLLQAKGKLYSVKDLLADDPVCSHLIDGYFCTVYLSPRDYHRVHMPLEATLSRMIHVPGRLFSVAPYTARHIPRLFARNERVICVFETANGPMVLVLVGAMLVSSTQTVWAGEVTPNKNRRITVTDYKHENITLAKGQEMGRFNMGSTVIVLMPRKSVASHISLHAGDDVKVGQTLMQLSSAGETV